MSAGRSLRRKLGDALALFTLRADERAYLRLLKSSPEFDRAYYRARNPRLHPLFKLFPERHYLREGEAMGLMPNPRFSPYAYLAFNPDLAASGALALGPNSEQAGEGQNSPASLGARTHSGAPSETARPSGAATAPAPKAAPLRPLEHYLRIGLREGRSGYDAPNPDEGLSAPPPPEAPTDPAPVAVVLHLYYPELWPEFAARLAAQRFDFDLFVTLTGPASRSESLEGQIRAAFPKAAIWHLGNRGRDILPFLRLVNAGLLARYRAVCKLHGKVSPHRRDGAAWRQDLVGAVLGASELTAARLAQFLADESAGLWLAEGHLLAAPEDWGPNLPQLKALLARLPPEAQARAEIRAFPAGSIWWVKPAVLAQLAALQLTAEDFEPERGLVDATLAHVIERAMGPLTLAAGLRLCEGGGVVPKGNLAASGAVDPSKARRPAAPRS